MKDFIWIITGIGIVLALSIILYDADRRRWEALTPEQQQAELAYREQEEQQRRRTEQENDSIFCSPCFGPHIGMDGKLRYGISPFGIGF